METHDDTHGSTTARRLAALLLLAPLALGACDSDSLTPPEPEAGDLFQRYVALGASITSGFQAGGIHVGTQEESYPNLLAEAAGTEFNLPAFSLPGCPPPYTDILAGERLGGGDATTCTLRSSPIPDEVHNLAVPGAEIGDLTDNLGSGSQANALTQFILGGRTQLEAAADAQPTFVTVFAGGNDVLDALRQGDPSLTTDVPTFAAEYDSAASRLAAMESLQGAALIGIPNVLSFDAQGRPTFPHLSLGAAYFQASQSPAWPSNYTVNNNCAPNTVFPDGQDGHLSAVPFGYGFGQLFAAAQQGQTVELDCVNDAPVLTVSEAQQVGSTIQQYNQVIASEAQEHGWVFVDATPMLEGFRDQGLIPPFPTITDPSVPLFGPVYSQDGIHLDLMGHAATADLLAQEINAAYGTEIPTGD